MTIEEIEGAVLKELEKRYLDLEDVSSELDWYGIDGEDNGMRDFAKETIGLTLQKAISSLFAELRDKFISDKEIEYGYTSIGKQRLEIYKEIRDKWTRC